MNMRQLLQQQIMQWILGGGVAILFSAAARALPEPRPMGSRFYAWFYRFGNNVLANPDKARLSKQ
jgi:hypothetical protein